MSDPERLERGLGDLLRRADWQGPAPTDPAPLPPEEHARWKSLLDEPAPRQQAPRRLPLGLVGATGLVAAVLVVAIGIGNFRARLPAGGPVIPAPNAAEPSSRPEPQGQTPIAPTASGPGTRARLPKAITPPQPATPALRTAPPRPQVPPALLHAKSSRPTPSVPTGEASNENSGVLDEGSIAAARRMDRAADSAASKSAEASRPQQTEGTATVAPAPAELARTLDAVVTAPGRVELVASDLEESAATSLRAHLATATLPAGVRGELVFEIAVGAGGVQQLRLIEAGSTIAESKAIESIRAYLLAWTPPAPVNLSRIVLRVQP